MASNLNWFAVEVLAKTKQLKKRENIDIACYLQNCESEVLILSFEEIENILRQELPLSAREYRAMWANVETNSLAASWLRAGYRTTEVDLENKK